MIIIIEEYATGIRHRRYVSAAEQVYGLDIVDYTPELGDSTELIQAVERRYLLRRIP
jgi:hypothetical protein